jgi:hypothetical protein
LRHQLAVLQRSSPRPRVRTSDRLFWVLLCRLWSGWLTPSPWSNPRPSSGGIGPASSCFGTAVWEWRVDASAFRQPFDLARGEALRAAEQRRESALGCAIGQDEALRPATVHDEGRPVVEGGCPAQWITTPFGGFAGLRTWPTGSAGHPLHGPPCRTRNEHTAPSTPSMNLRGRGGCQAFVSSILMQRRDTNIVETVDPSGIRWGDPRGFRSGAASRPGPRSPGRHTHRGG